MGKLIVIEGAGDGIGKSTQLELLKEYLTNLGYKVATHHFPSYDNYSGVGVTKYLSGEYGNISSLSPYFINSLYAVDRAIIWIEKLKPMYEDDYIILLDRYTPSSLIYQSSVIENKEERTKFIDYVIDYEYHKLGIKEPDLVIFLNASFEHICKLRNKRNETIKADIHEEDIKFMHQVYENSQFIAKYQKLSIIKCDTKADMRSITEINNDIIKLVKKKILKK